VASPGTFRYTLECVLLYDRYSVTVDNMNHEQAGVQGFEGRLAG